MNNTGEKTLCVGKDKVMGSGVTIIVGASAVLDFDHKGIFPSVKNITDEVLKLNIQKVDGGERPLLREINDFIVGKLNQVGRPEINRYVPPQLNFENLLHGFSNSIRKSVKRMGVENFIRIGVCSSIEDWILDDMEGLCAYL